MDWKKRKKKMVRNQIYECINSCDEFTIEFVVFFDNHEAQWISWHGRHREKTIENQ